MALRKQKIGKMRERIEIMSVADAPHGEYSSKRTLTLVAARWSQMTEYTITQRSARGIGENITHRFKIREGLEIDVDYVIRFNGNIYKIENTEPMGSDRDDVRGVFTGIFCEFQGTEDAYYNPSPESE